MPKYPALVLPDDPKLAHNITHFARALRAAGLPIGSGRVIDAIEAVRAAGFTSKDDFYWVLHACFVSRADHRRVFAQVFRLFWRNPQYLEHMMEMLLPTLRRVRDEQAPVPAAKRAAEALLAGAQVETDADAPPKQDERTEIEIDSTLTVSTEERLRTLDFEQMSTEEVTRAKRIIAGLRLPVKPIRSRRVKPAVRGARPDWQRTLRESMRQGGDIQSLARSQNRQRWPNLVVICDISGSMSQYSRIILHFLHSVANTRGEGWAKVHGFTFGTQLTNVTRHLRHRDVDAAMAAAGAEAQDWEGGTRIGSCLQAFNRDWSRRVLGQGAVVLLITDGLDRDDPGILGAQMQRLHLSARRLIWLNPLLRWDGFAPKARGIQAMLPHVDSFRAGHSIASLEDLAAVISDSRDSGEKERLLRLMAL